MRPKTFQQALKLQKKIHKINESGLVFLHVGEKDIHLKVRGHLHSVHTIEEAIHFSEGFLRGIGRDP